MKNFNIKVTIAISGGLLVFGLLFYFIFPSEKIVISKSSMLTKKFNPIILPQSAVNEVDWPEAMEQAKGELYDLFTPPEIYLNALGEFVFRTPYFISSDDPFGIELVEINRNPYRFQLDGFIEEDRSDDSQTVILIHSVEDGKSLRLSPNASNSKYQIKLLDWSVRTINERDGNMRVVANLKLQDYKLDRIVNLRHDKKLFEEKISVVLAVEESAEQYILEGENSSFFIGDIEYRLDAIDSENQTVLVTKLIPDNDPISELLEIEAIVDNSKIETDDSGNLDFEDAFDSFF
mgnify:CR=1 FL=1